MSGTADLVVAGGVQNMSHPDLRRHDRRRRLGSADPFSGSDGWTARYGEQEVSSSAAPR